MILSSARIWYERLVLERPWLALALLGLALVSALPQMGAFRLDASADSLLLEDDPDLRYFRTVIDRYSNRDFLIVTWSPGQSILSADSRARLEALRADLLSVPAVEDVVTILDVPLLNSPPISFSELGSVTRTVRDADTDLEMAEEELRTSPFYSNLLMSADGSTTALILYLEGNARGAALLAERTRLRDARADDILDDVGSARLAQVERQYDRHLAAWNEADERTTAQVRTVLDRHRSGVRMFLGGVRMIASDMITFIENDLRLFGIVVFAFLAGFLAIIFRQWRWVLLPLSGAVLASALMVGLLGAVRWPVTVISSNFIALLLIISISMTVHLVVRFREMESLYPQATSADLAGRTVRFMAQPILYTVLTTMVAFVSLLVSGIRPVIDFGHMMTAGIAMAFVIMFLLFPAVTSLLPRRRDENHDITLRVTRAFARLSDRHRKGIVAAALLLAVAGITGALRLDVENRFIDYFAEDTEIYQGMLEIDRVLGGTTTLDIVLEKGDEDVAPVEEGDDFYADFGDSTQELGLGYWFNSLRMGELRRVHDWLEDQPEIGKVLSMDTLVRMAESVNQGVPLDDLRLGLLRESLQKLPDHLQEVLVRPYLSEDGNSLRIQLRVIDSDPDLRRAELLERVDAFLLQDLGYTEDRFRLSGLLVLYNNMLQSLFASQIQTLGFVFLAILGMFLVLFRSLYQSLIAIAANMLPATMVLGAMGWFGVPLDLMTITIAAISVGIAVDNTIHYLVRFRKEFPRDRDYRATLYRCHGSIGQAMYYTSITITGGFSVLMLSNFTPSFYFGLFTGLAMLTALLASLILLPALLLLLRPLGPGTTTGASSV